MSRLFPERLLLALAPDLGSRGGDTSWQGALATLEATPIEHSCHVTVVLSNHFVRYTLVPWNDAIDSGEEEAYVRHHFLKIHGERAKGWTVRAAPAAAGAARLASAIDAPLLTAIQESMGRKEGARLVSVQPDLMHRFNQARRSIPPRGAWLVMAEPGLACVALHARGQWLSVQKSRAPWRAVLERARIRLADAVEGDLPEIHLHEVAPSPRVH